jgi:hypothetical protein
MSGDLTIGRMRVHRNGMHAAAPAGCVLHDDMVDRGVLVEVEKMLAACWA